MRPDGLWRGEVIRGRTSRVGVRQRAVIGVPGSAGWATIGQIRATVDQVREPLGDAFTELVDAD